MTLPVYVLAVVLWLCAGFAQAAPVVLNDNQDTIALGTFADYTIDRDKTLTLNDVIQRKDFVRGRHDALNFGLTQSRVWLRLDIRNPLSHDQNRVLTIPYFMLDDIHLYSPTGEEGNYSVTKRGRLHPQHDSRFPGRFYSFAIDLPADSERVYYLSVDSCDSLALPLVLATPHGQQQYVLKDAILLTLFFGVCISNIFFALFMLGTLRERELIYYSGFLITNHLLFFATIEGVPHTLFGIDNTYLNRDSIAIFISLSMALALLFARNFLRLKQTFPLAYTASHYILAMLIAATLQAFFMPPFYAITISTTACMILGAHLGISSLGCALQQHREARMFLMAWSCGILGAVIYGLKVFNLIPVTPYTSYSWHVGTVMEAILFSYTIADRVVTERKQRLQTQTTLAEKERALRVTQEQLLHAETAAKEDLETRVRERTRDLSRILAELEIENRNLTELSINDGLTRVRNRRFFNDIYPQLWQEACESEKWISVVMLDIDSFKAVNDTYGHLMGDRCLVAVAGLLKKLISRPSDVICRYGGEEFIVILPDTDPRSAQAVAERVRIRIGTTAIEQDGRTLQVTASFGVAGLIPQSGQDAMQLIASCDDALYASKQGGRNRITVAGTPDIPNNVTPLHRNT